MYAKNHSNTDHPRGCGEHNSLDSDYYDNVGSSPRMRGALNLWSVVALNARIIPADAGSTQSLR